MKNSRNGTFLKECRHSIDPGVHALGPYARLPARCGKPVTQEEIAEAVGVSRVWYGMLESGATVRTSARLLDKLARALMLTSPDRAALFRWAFPELALSQEATSVLESCRLIRTVTKRLWSASSPTEALTAACEQLAEWFDDAAVVTRLQRLAAGTWEWVCVVDRGQGVRVTEAWQELAPTMTPKQIDLWFLFPQLAHAGEVGSVDHQPAPLRRTLLDAYRRRDLFSVAGFMQGRICTRQGSIAGFHVMHDIARAYSEADRAVMGTFAELASLALS